MVKPPASAHEIGRFGVENKKRSAWQTALRLISGRELSAYKLRQALQKRAFDEIEIENVLDELKSFNYVNDSRYAELKIRSLCLRCYGPLYIKKVLNQEQLIFSLDEINKLINKIAFPYEEHLLSHIKKRIRSNDVVNRPTEYRNAISKLIRYYVGKGHDGSLVSKLAQTILRACP